MADESKRLDLAERVAERLRASGGAPAPALPPATGPVTPNPVYPVTGTPQPEAAPANDGPQQAAKAVRTSLPPADPNDPRFLHIDLRKLYSAGYVSPDGVSNRISEEFRVIKRPLLLNAFPRTGVKAPKSHVIMITSAKPGEGKTFTAINLGMSIASEPDLNVLLIDTDSHNQDMEERLGIKDRPGLLDVLAGSSLSISDVILRTNIPNFSVVPCGQRHSMETELMASQRMVDMVDDIARRYPDRVIIFDTVPALASSVAGVLALHVGQVVIVVEAESTQRQALDETVALVSGCKNVSLLLNKCRYQDSGGFGYYGYYGNEDSPNKL
ncbi:MAG: AAA family ATPase [Alphaproteobacteria bacterium]